MRVFAPLDAQLPLAEVAATVSRIEQLGYDGIHVPETTHDSMMVALLALQSSTALTVRTAVTVAFPRSPMVLALAAWDLAQFSGGRFELGLGTQVRPNIEGRYGVPWSDPVGRMRDYVGALRAIWTAFQDGGPLRFDSAHYKFTRLQPYFNPGPIACPTIPVYLGGIGPAMCALAGTVADGLITHPTGALPAVLAEASAAVRAHGSAAVIASAQYVSGADPAAIALNREAKRRSLAFLYSTPAYRGALERLGMADRADRLHLLSRAGEWSEMAAVVDDAMLDAIAPTASYPELPQLLAGRYGALADGLVIAPPVDPGEDLLMARALAVLRG
ncbi:TIGR03617 family F420-dependent LLM class oxidoreductase [Tomitella biformata]|uniref:TIGR03617 family F420-dependent LLM class oxidoreductase n=1 Tax=Tomitella biformata TaxID=630403 RepID=UPI0004643892|nr:TIGR03617 family F420-dependent LLM class oxidoreductase [Tomitella biformata]